MTTLEMIQRFVAGGQRAQHPHPRVVSYEDRDILNKLPITTAANYRYCDTWDAMMTRSRLRTCGSIVESVSIEIAAQELRERRAGQ